LFFALVAQHFSKAIERSMKVSNERLIEIATLQKTFMLSSNHECFNWFEKTHRPRPSIQNSILWTKNAVVGIGNAVNGIVRALHYSLAQNRTVMFQSVMVEKLCHSLHCNWTPFSADMADNVDVVNLLHVRAESATLDKVISPVGKSAGGDQLAAFYDASGCSMHVPYQDARSLRFCLYSKLLSGFISSSYPDRFEPLRKYALSVFIRTTDFS
jgi:hypothetical protein